MRKRGPTNSKGSSQLNKTTQLPRRHTQLTDCQFGARQRETEKERDRLLTYEVLLLTQNIKKIKIITSTIGA